MILTMDVDLHVEGVLDRTVADAIRRRVGQLRRSAESPGEWRITMSPSETRGQWDLGLQVASRRHFASFSGAIERLPDLIEWKLREFLELPSPAIPSVTKERAR